MRMLSLACAAVLVTACAQQTTLTPCCTGPSLQTRVEPLQGRSFSARQERLVQGRLARIAAECLASAGSEALFQSCVSQKAFEAHERGEFGPDTRIHTIDTVGI